MASLADTNLYYGDGEHPLHGTWLSVDVIALTMDSPSAKMALIKREGTPHCGATTLPGGLLAAWDGETVEQAARRIVRSKLGAEIRRDVAVVDVVSDPRRDERGHTVSVVVAACITGDVEFASTEIPDDMPFGHSGMAVRALETLSRRVLVDPDATYALLGSETNVNSVAALFRLLDPKLSEAAVRSRLDRSALYLRGGTRVHIGNGRPFYVYRRTLP